MSVETLDDGTIVAGPTTKRGAVGRSGGGDGSATVTDPRDVGNDGSNSGGNDNRDEPRKSRGRPRGSGNAGRTGSKKENSLHLGGLEQAVLSVHAMLAGFLEIPELVLEKEEAEQLLKGVENVGRHYASGAVPQKTADWISLLTTIGGLYGPRYMHLRMRMAAEAARDVTPKAPPKSAGAPPSSASFDDIQSRLHAAG